MTLISPRQNDSIGRVLGQANMAAIVREVEKTRHQSPELDPLRWQTESAGDIVEVHNTSGYTIAAHRPVVLSAPAYDLNDSLYTPTTEAAYLTCTATVPDSRHCLGIAVEPMNDGTLGRVKVKGSMIVQLREGPNLAWCHRAGLKTWADADTLLEITPEGLCKVVWRETPTKHPISSVNATDDELDMATDEFEPGEEVIFETDGTLPAGLAADTSYWIIKSSGGWIKVTGDSTDPTRLSYEIDFTNNAVLSEAHGLLAGDVVMFGTDGKVGTGLDPNQEYEVLNVIDADSFTITTDGSTPFVFDTVENDRPLGSQYLYEPNTAVDITDGGTGSHTVRRGKLWAFVQIDPPEVIQLIGTASGDITVNTTSGTVKVWHKFGGLVPPQDTEYEIDGVCLDWMHGTADISDGKQVLIEWFANEFVWRVVGAECEDVLAPPTIPADWAGPYPPAGRPEIP